MTDPSTEHRFALPGPRELWFCALFAVASTAAIAPLWLGTVPLLPDAASAAADAALWSRADDLPVPSDAVRVRWHVGPGLATAHLAALLAPVTDSLVALRIYLAAVFAATAIGLAVSAETFGRTRWVALPGLALLWTGAFVWRGADQMITLPLFFWGLVLARRAPSERWYWSIGLAVLVAASFLHDPVGAWAIAASSLVVGVLAVPRLGALPRALTPLPAAAVGWWALPPEAPVGRPAPTIRAVLDAGQSEPGGVLGTLRDLVSVAADGPTGELDTFLLVAVAACWALIATARRRGLESPPDEDTTPQTHTPRSTWERAADSLKDRPLWVLAVLLGTASFVLPTWTGATDAHLRLAPLLIGALALLPDPRTDSPLADLACGAAVLSLVALGTHVGRETIAFDRTETAPLVSLLRRAPAGSRIACLGPESEAEPRTPSRASLCRALVSARTVGWVGYPDRGHSGPVVPIGEAKPPRLVGTTSALDRLRDWDAVAVYGTERPVPAGLKRVASIGDRSRDVSPWTLYTVERSDDS